MIRIIVDGVVFTNQHQLGIQRYFYEMLSRVGVNCNVTVYYNSPALCPTPYNVSSLHRKSQYSKKIRGNMSYYMDAVRRRISQVDAIPRADIFHSTYYSSKPARIAYEVVTVYDMIAELYPYDVCSGNSEIEKKRSAIQRADRIIAISSSTASDIHEIYPETRDKTTVIHLGADHIVPYAVCHKDVLLREEQQPFVLFVGDRRGYKNYRVVVEAMACSLWPRDLLLHVVGPPFTEGELLYQRRHRVADRIVYKGRLSDEDLSEEYARAHAFVFPALCEGFGMPLIEAQVNGTPVICSDIPVFRELARDTVCYFNPRDSEHLAWTINHPMEPGMAESLAQRGRANAERYKWSNCAEHTLRVYEGILS